MTSQERPLKKTRRGAAGGGAHGTRGGVAPVNRWLMLALRVLIAGALVVSAVIHFQLAPGFQQAYSSGVGGGNLFRLQGVVAILAGLYVLVRGTPRSYLVAGLVALASLAAVIVYRYIQIPTIGPIPSMYEPVWYPSKTITAVAEAIAVALAFAGYALSRKWRSESSVS